MADTLKPIPDCEFCCVPLSQRSILFHQRHPKCGACGIFMGTGHVEPDAEAKFCSTCSRTRRGVGVA